MCCSSSKVAHDLDFLYQEPGLRKKKTSSLSKRQKSANILSSLLSNGKINYSLLQKTKTSLYFHVLIRKRTKVSRSFPMFLQITSPTILH
jgi:hypothetical protein